MEARLDGRVAVITGASRGIGAAVALGCWRLGAQVVRLARSLADGVHDGVRDIPCDVADWAQVERAARTIEREYGVPDLVVNNAGAFLLQPLEQTSAADFARQVDVNLRGPFHVARAFLPGMRAAGQGRFITIGSVADHVAYPGNSAYAASKFGLRGLHETLLAEFQGGGVMLTLVSPGPTDTAAWDPIDPDRREGFIRRADMLRPADVADAVLFAATRPAHVRVDWLRVMPG
ncbi:MAG: SDR family oxidoreductase [Gemmatimonadales bacterium]|nr:SDR family oxidoreductase [Gemmatimonadales bacterium]